MDGLIEQCKPPYTSKFSYKTNLFAHYYGTGYWLKKYAGFPTNLPIMLYIDHAPFPHRRLFHFDFNSKFKKALFANGLRRNAEEKFKRTYITGATFIICRKLLKIQRDPNPKGTVCFPLHSSHSIDFHTDLDKYCEELKSLPEKYHPITICIYHLDITRGLHKVFLDHGFDVVTAGHKHDDRFPQRFYDIIKDKKYATSNTYSSSLLYCVEFGIPFFMSGSTVEIEVNNIGASRKSSLDTHMNIFGSDSLAFQADRLFCKRLDHITNEQKEYVEQILGLDENIISPKQLNFVLWREFFLNIHIVIKNLIADLTSRVIAFFKSRFNRLSKRVG